MEKEPKKKWTAEQLARGEDFLHDPLPEHTAEIDAARRRIMERNGGPTPPLPSGYVTQVDLYMARKKAGLDGDRQK